MESGSEFQSLTVDGKKLDKYDIRFKQIRPRIITDASTSEKVYREKYEIPLG